MSNFLSIIRVFDPSQMTSAHSTRLFSPLNGEGQVLSMPIQRYMDILRPASWYMMAEYGRCRISNSLPKGLQHLAWHQRTSTTQHCLRTCRYPVLASELIHLLFKVHIEQTQSSNISCAWDKRVALKAEALDSCQVKSSVRSFHCLDKMRCTCSLLSALYLFF
jgi:hypothetical protein